MKCPNCNGVPYDEVWTCEVCNGKGIVEPLTNDEWRRTCSTEEFADFLADACAWAIEEQRCYKHTEKSTATFWKQWLKEKYQPCNTL